MITHSAKATRQQKSHASEDWAQFEKGRTVFVKYGGLGTLYQLYLSPADKHYSKKARDKRYTKITCQT